MTRPARISFIVPGPPAQALMKEIVIKACDDREFSHVCDHQVSAAQAHHTTALRFSQEAIDGYWC